MFAVHGFLGNSEDFNQLAELLKPYGIELKSPSLFSNQNVLCQISTFVSILEKEWTEYQFGLKFKPQKNIFLGYSFGARLGLKLLAKNPELFDKWIFVSCHPGFDADETELKKARMQSDQIWADQITFENWNEFVGKWFSQEVFKQSICPERPITNFDLGKLKKALTEESLGLQPDYRQLLMQYKNRILWVVGSRDQKFLSISNDLKTKGIIQNPIVLPAGHRVHMDAPSDLVNILVQQLS